MGIHLRLEREHPGLHFLVLQLQQPGHMAGNRRLHLREGAVQRLHLADIRPQGRQRRGMLNVEPADLPAHLSQRSGDPEGKHAGNKHRQQQGAEGNQQDHHNLLFDRLHQVRLPDGHHGVKAASPAGNAAKQAAGPVRGKLLCQVRRRLSGKRFVFPLPGRENTCALAVIEIQFFPQTRIIGHQRGDHAADPLFDFNVAAPVAEIVVVLHHQGNELPAVRVGNVFGQGLVRSGKKEQLVGPLPVQAPIPGFCLRPVFRHFVRQAGGYAESVPGIQVDLVNRPVRENDQGKDHGQLVRLLRGAL